MDTPTVAMLSLAALTAFDLAPKPVSNLAQALTTEPLSEKFLTLAAATAATSIEPIAPPEVTKMQTVAPQQSKVAARLVDVNGHWAQPFIEILQAKGIVHGFDDGTFRPDQAIAPQHLIAMVQQAMEQHGDELWQGSINSLRSPTQKAMPLPALISAKLTDGTLRQSVSQYLPANARRKLNGKTSKIISLTRAEAALFVYQALARVGAVPPPKMPDAPKESDPSALKEAAKAEAGDESLPMTKLSELPLNQSVSQAEEILIASLKMLRGQKQTPKPKAPQPKPGNTVVAQQLAPPQPASPVPAVTLPAIPNPKPSIDPSQPADLDPPKPPAVNSQLGDLVTGDRSKNFDGYWNKLCVNNPTELPKALAACDQILSVNPQAVKVWIVRGNLLVQAANYAEAVASYDRALALAPPTAELHTQRCRALSAQGQQNEAVAACEAAIQLDKDWGSVTVGDAWFAKGTALKRLGQNEAATAAYEKALVYAPDNSEIWTEQCRVLSELDKQAEAVATCDRALAVNKNWGDRSPAIAWLNQALALTRQNKLQAAVAAYDKALELAPKDPATWTKQGTLLASLGKHPDALAAYDQALKLSPNFSLALLHRCAALNQLGNHEAALAACDQAIGGDGRWGDLGVTAAWDQRGTALAGLGRLDEALASADRAIALKPDFAAAYSNRAVTLWRMEEYTQALTAVDKAVQLKSDYSQGWFNKGRILRSMQQYEAAIAAYDEALKGDINRNDKPTLADIWVNRSAALWRLGKFPEALDSANRAVAVDSKSAIAWYNRGVALLALKQPSEAVKSYTRATKLNPKDAFAWTGQAIALQQVQKYQAAIAALDEALRLNPNQTLAQQTREAVLKQLEPPKPTAEKIQ